MPLEVFDFEKFIGLSEKARYCSVKNLSNSVKFKIHTSKRLYTLQVNPTQKDEILKKLKCEVREV